MGGERLGQINEGVINEMIVPFFSQALLALIVLLVGWKIITKLSRVIASRLEKSKIEPSLSSFLTSVTKVILQVVLLITVASMVGVEVTTFVALIASLGFAIGLALQGSLANFAGGVLILTLKPFKVGDYIEAAGYAGTVSEIQVFYTILNTPDNKKVIIPNANLSNASAVNYSAYDTRRIDFQFGVGYDDDIDKVRGVLQRLAQENELIFDDPPPQIVVAEHGDSAVVFYMRVWCNSGDYWTIYFDMMEQVKKAFDEADINIPYPQMDMHTHST